MDADRSETGAHELTRALCAATDGRTETVDRLFTLVEPELRKRVVRELAHRPPDSLTQTTAVVHDVFLRLAGERGPWQDRDHYFGVATIVVRRLLVDLARREKRHKRGGGRPRPPLPDDLAAAAPDPDFVLDLDAAIERLKEMRPRWARIAELRAFGGLGNHEIAAVLDVAPSTVEHDWKFVRAWLHRELS